MGQKSDLKWYRERARKKHSSYSYGNLTISLGSKRSGYLSIWTTSTMSKKVLKILLHYILLRGQRSKSSTTKWHMKAAVLEAELHILDSFSFKNKNTEIYSLKHTSIMSLNWWIWCSCTCSMCVCLMCGDGLFHNNRFWFFGFSRKTNRGCC